MSTPNYERPPMGTAVQKFQMKTRADDKVEKTRKVVNLDRAQKELVRKRDVEACRVCLKKTRHVHERLFKSLGGVASLANSMVACPKCHPLLQGHAIRPLGQNCNHPLIFQMTKATAYLRFRNRPAPSHVEIVAVVARDVEAKDGGR